MQLIMRKVLLFFIFAAAPKAFSEEIKVEHLRIILDVKSSRKVPKDKAEFEQYLKDWKRACKNLGSAMVVGRGPYGFGVFGSYSCHLGGKFVAGADKPSRWSVILSDGLREVKFQLGHQEGAATTVISEYSAPSSEYFLRFFQDDEYTDLVAYSLLESSPMGMLVTKAQVKGSPPSFLSRYWRAGKARKFKYPVPDAPRYLVLYRLAWDDEQKQWRSQVVGAATRSKVDLPKRKRKGKRSTLSGGYVVYETTAAVDAALATGPLWAQSSEGPGTHRSEFQKTIKNAHLDLDLAGQNDALNDFFTGGKDLLTQILDAAASGYVGVRFGKEVLPGVGGLGALLNKTKIFGLLFEMRGGPLKGLRYYYDTMPRTRASLPGSTGSVDASISFSRHVVGFSWDFNPGFLFDRVTVDPKLGAWTFNATLPVAYDTSGNVAELAVFNLGRTFSLGLEVGLEELSSWYTVRGWYGINTGYSLLNSGGKITSNRFGVDAYFTGGPEIPFFGVGMKTALLAFYFYESIGLTSNSVSTAGPAAISGVSYDVGYAGLGLALSW